MQLAEEPGPKGLAVTIQLVRDDITRFDADAIVNAANSRLAPGGGVCGAIHAAAGPELARACAAHVAAHGPVPTGSAAMTPGFALPARWVIHAVGPVWNGGESGEAELLASAYRAAFSLADQSELSTIALPSISTGIYGFPVALAAPIALSSISEALATAHSTREATFVLFDEATLSAYENALAQV